MITARPSRNTTQIKYAWNFSRTTILHDLYGLHVHTILNCLFFIHFCSLAWLYNLHYDFKLPRILS